MTCKKRLKAIKKSVDFVRERTARAADKEMKLRQMLEYNALENFFNEVVNELEGLKL